MIIKSRDKVINTSPAKDLFRSLRNLHSTEINAVEIRFKILDGTNIINLGLATPKKVFKTAVERNYTRRLTRSILVNKIQKLEHFKSCVILIRFKNKNYTIADIVTKIEKILA